MSDQKILEPLIYFDIFEYPLTAVELWQWQRQLIDLAAVATSLTNWPQQLGYYFLPGRESLVSTRQQRYLLAEAKFKRRKFILRLIASLPYIRLVAVCNSLAYNNSRASSDLDLFIVVKPGKIWTTRLLTTLLLFILNLRPRPNQTQDKICPTFWVTADNLNLQSVTLGEHDIYFQYWLATLTPLYDAGGYYAALVKQNVWLKNFLPNWQGKLPALRRRLVLGPLALTLKSGLEKILVAAWLEQLISQQWLKFFPAKLKEMMNQDTRVVINNQMMKLHTTDRRAEYQRMFYENLAKQVNL